MTAPDATALQGLLDAEAIRSLIGAYLQAADRGRSADLAALFAPDGVLDIRGEGADAGVHLGPAAILEVLEANRARLAGTMETPLLRHHVSSTRLDLSAPDAPQARSYFLAVTEVGPDHWGRYDDRFARTADGLRFAHRAVVLEGWADPSWMARTVAAGRAA